MKSNRASGYPLSLNRASRLLCPLMYISTMELIMSSPEYYTFANYFLFEFVLFLEKAAK